MGNGTKYTSKLDLIKSNISKIFANLGFLVSADKIQTVINDVIESLWPTVLEINDGNVSVYHIAGNLVVPTGTNKLFINTTTPLKVKNLLFVDAITNGTEIQVCGNIQFWTGDGSSDVGRMSRYYYQYTFGHGSADYMIEGCNTFVYFNQVWYCNFY